ncbi:hypothetical protein GCM10007073_19410 [Micrococcus flavus]|nr:hypothetical protein GCM10007073_19410 [Micrococcus flavus]
MARGAQGGGDGAGLGGLAGAVRALEGEEQSPTRGHAGSGGGGGTLRGGGGGSHPSSVDAAPDTASGRRPESLDWRA